MSDRPFRSATRRLFLGRALRTPIDLLALVALALPSAAAAQQATERQVAETLQAQIRTAEQRDGPTSAGVIGPLTELGALYAENGERFLANAALRQAVQAVRVNYGLHSLEQAPLIRRMIANADSVGDRTFAWDLEQGLLALASRYPDDLRSAEILRDTADRRMELLARYNAGEAPPEIVLGCYYNPPRDARDGVEFRREQSCTAGSAHRVREGLTKEAQTYYATAVDIILRNQRFSSEELPALLMGLVDSSYRYGNPSLGRRSLTYLLAYKMTNSDAWSKRVDTLVQIADWDLVHAVGRDEEEAALAEYEQAYRLSEEAGAAQESIALIFSPDDPVILPVFLPNPFAKPEAREYTGHIDVAFEVDRYGRSRHVRILETSDNATRLAERRLVQLISRARFRPRISAGLVADAAPLVVRYDFDALDDADPGWWLYWAPSESLQRGELVDRRTPNE
jgi:hypothetical protein